MDRPFLSEHGIIDDDLEGGLVEPGTCSTVSRRFHTAARHAKHTSLRVSYILLPSFLSSRFHACVPSKPPSQPRYTSALDGIRGCACVAVMNYHILWVYQPLVHYGYALSRQDLASCVGKADVDMHNDSVLQLPIIRLFYSGTGSVSAFFVIAGFALAHKPIALSRKGRRLEMFSALASSTFRRGLRLYLPVIAASLFSLITFRLGWWQYRDIVTSVNHAAAMEVSEPIIARQSTLWLQIRDWLQDLSGLLNAWDWSEYYPRYDAHLWSIGSELRASMATFLTLPVYVLMKNNPFRTILILLLIFHAYANHRWEVALFLSGIPLAEMSQARHGRLDDERAIAHQPIFLGARAPRTPTWRLLLTSLSQSLLLTLALYALSAPDFCLAYTPGYRILSRLIPPHDPGSHRFYPSLGAFLAVFLVSYNPPDWFLNRYILNSSIVQYFGRISFSLYLVHGPLLHMVGYRLIAWTWSCTGRDGMLAYWGGFCIAYGVFVALVVWTADVFWRVVDVRSVRFAAWLERWVMESGAGYPST